MAKSPLSRRGFVQNTIGAVGFLSLPRIMQHHNVKSSRKFKIVCVGGHPDDPESGCGGTLAKLAAAGNDVTIIYLTRGEAGIEGKSFTETASIRSLEAEDACKILNAKPVFAGQVDGDTIVNSEWIKKLLQLISNEKPDIVFTHWPIDSHKDHQAASVLTIQAWMRTKEKFELYFFEVCTGEQTMIFRPTDYIDISEVQEQKRRSVFCHKSQDPPGIYGCGHSSMEEFRGREISVKAAEAFVRMTAIHKESLLMG